MRASLPLALLAALVLAACTGGSEATAERGFYAEFAIELEPEADDRIAALGLETHGNSSLRWWYGEGADGIGRWRWEIESGGPSIDAGTTTTVFDGEQLWGYDDRLNSYQRDEPLALPAGIIQSPSFGAPVGPANVEDVDAFIELMQLGRPDGEVTRAGEAIVLGRQAEVIEIRPAWTGSSSSGSAASEQTTQSEETVTSGGVVRVFIDPERMFIMRWATDGGAAGPSSTVEITHLDYDISVDSERLTFDPPSGARANTAVDQPQDCSSRLSAGGGLDAPAGLLDPAYVPAGFRSGMMSAESGANGGCNSVAAQSLVENDSGGFVLLRQRIRPDGVPNSLRSDDGVRINGRDAYPSEDAGITRLVWSSGDVVAELLSNVLPSEELLRIAESAQIRPEDDRQ